MKIEDRRAILRAAGASPRTRLIRAAGAGPQTRPPKVTGLAPGALTVGAATNRQSTIDNRHLAIGNWQWSIARRRGSVLVLVMTILGILFVLGVAFLASMNFEAEMIAASTQRDRAESRVTTVVDQLGSTLRDGMMSGARAPFGNPAAALSATAFAEMPWVQNSFSAIEPHWEPGPDGILGNADDQLVFSPYLDAAALKQHPFAGPSLPQAFAIDTGVRRDTTIDSGIRNGSMIVSLPDGTNLKRCLGGPNQGNSCDLPADCPGSVCEGPRVVDADGDGIVDSLEVDARVLDLSGTQLAALAARLNPPTNPTGKVYVGLRVVPHGGLVNLNASHPKLIDNIFDLPLNLPDPPDFLARAPDPEYGSFYHRPTQNQVAYSPLLEESTLRRRGLLPSRSVPSSSLQGDPLVDRARYPNGKADMQWQLFPPKWPGGAVAGKFEAVFETDHRFTPYLPAELFPGDPEYGYWPVRMEPFTSAAASPGTAVLPVPDYDRRHLVTTVSHDDLLARGGRVPSPTVPGSEEDILTKMTQANQTAWDPEMCPVLLPFEFVDYPQTIANPLDASGSPCCPTDLGCKLNARKGRLQLSLPYLDDQIDAAQKIPDLKLRQEAVDRIFRLIHDAFFLLVRNAAHVTTLEGTPCVKRCLDGPNKGNFCKLNGECPGSICESVDCLYANGACGDNNRCTVATIPPAPTVTFTDCRSTPTRPIPDPCSIPGSVCRPTDGVCTIQAPYWQDISCDAAHPTACDVAPGEVCDPAIRLCVDAWTGQTHSQALISRTAAALTANLIDYADADDIPTRIALRSLDLTTGKCIAPVASVGRVCDMDADCGSPGTCLPPRGMCVDGANTGRVCGSDAACGTGGLCTPPAKAAGREFDFDRTANVCRGGSYPGQSCSFPEDCPGGTCPVSLRYVYGVERQPYITEVATYSANVASIPPPDIRLKARAVELFNPYPDPIDGNEQYFLAEVNPVGGARPPIPLNVGPRPNIGANPQPFTVFITASDAASRTAILVGSPATVKAYDLTGANELKFENGSVIYLLRAHTYPGDLNVTYIVVDQFEVKGEYIGKEGPNPALEGTFSVQRMVRPESPWTATVPLRDAEMPGATLGDWNTLAPNPPPHPVEVNFADLDWFGRPFRDLTNPNNPRNGSVSFPTTGSLLMLMRHANRSLADYTSPSGTVKALAFTTHLVGDSTVTNPATGAPVATIPTEQQIDNGRMPIFDIGARSTIPGDPQFYAAHHVSPSATQLGAPGNLDTLPWGQLVFDYFTALPLSNPGPYFGPDKDKVALPDSLPRVDMEGLRVHGRININAAPWKVLAGLPFIPMQKVPVAFKAKMRRTLGLVDKSAVDPLHPDRAELIVKDADAGTIGEHLAQGIIAYRELRPVGASGDYRNGTPAVVPPLPAAPVTYGRGWGFNTPMARRGTGFMSVGELANVRHYGAATITPPLPPGFPNSLYRIDSGVIDPTNTNPPNTQNFVDAVAALVALGDWVTVRSQVFTVYGVLRGEDDTTIVDPNAVKQQTLRTQDADSRALRFQETIDRLPTFLGESVPSRIGNRSLSRYTDAHND